MFLYDSFFACKQATFTVNDRTLKVKLLPDNHEGEILLQSGKAVWKLLDRGTELSKPDCIND